MFKTYINPFSYPINQAIFNGLYAGLLSHRGTPIFIQVIEETHGDLGIPHFKKLPCARVGWQFRLVIEV